MISMLSQANTVAGSRKMLPACLVVTLALAFAIPAPAVAQNQEQEQESTTEPESQQADSAQKDNTQDKPVGEAKDHQAHVVTLGNEHLTVGVLPQAEGRVVLLRRPDGQNVLQSAETSWESPDKSTGGMQVWNLYVPEVVAREDVLGDYQPALGQYEVTEHTDTRITVTGPHDHPRALNITKTLELKPDGAVDYIVKITNEGDMAGVWDIWNVCEHPPHAANFVPIDEKAPDMGVRKVDESGDGIASTTAGSFFSFLNRGDGMGKDAEARESEAYIQPRTGLSVVFNGNTAFVREFEVVPEDLIFRDRGQVEMANLLAPDPMKGHLKISVHSPFKPLKSGETLEHRETWRLLEYDPPREEGAPFSPERERDQMLIFLNEHELAKPQPLRAPEPGADIGAYDAGDSRETEPQSDDGSEKESQEKEGEAPQAGSNPKNTQ